MHIHRHHDNGHTHNHSRFHERAKERYSHDKHMMDDTFDFAERCFLAPIEATQHMGESASAYSNPLVKFGGGVATLLTPFVVLPFSTTAAVLTAGVALPALSVKAAVDKLIVKLS